MSTYPAPTTPPAHSYPSNKTVDPTAVLISLMHHSLQKNATTIAQLNSRPSPQPAQQPLPLYQFKPHFPPSPKWYGTPPTSPLFFSQIATYKSEAFYAGVLNWTHTTLTNQQLIFAISSDMPALLPLSISSMLLNDKQFASDGITMISLLLNHINHSSNENFLLGILYLTRPEMRLGESSIAYMSRVRGISKKMLVVTIYRIIPLFAITSLDHDRYPGVKSHYLAGDTALVNCDLLQLSGLLSSEETRQRALGILNFTEFSTISNCVSSTPSNPPKNGCPTPQPHQPPTQSSSVA